MLLCRSKFRAGYGMGEALRELHPVLYSQESWVYSLGKRGATSTWVIHGGFMGVVVTEGPIDLIRGWGFGGLKIRRESLTPHPHMSSVSVRWALPRKNSVQRKKMQTEHLLATCPKSGLQWGSNKLNNWHAAQHLVSFLLAHKALIFFQKHIPYQLPWYCNNSDHPYYTMLP